jgi:hypothetical protein
MHPLIRTGTAISHRLRHCLDNRPGQVKDHPDTVHSTLALAGNCDRKGAGILKIPKLRERIDPRMPVVDPPDREPDAGRSLPANFCHPPVNFGLLLVVLRGPVPVVLVKADVHFRDRELQPHLADRLHHVTKICQVIPSFEMGLKPDAADETLVV